MQFFRTAAFTFAKHPINTDKQSKTDFFFKTNVDEILICIYRQEIHVKVVHAAPLQTEYLVDLDHDLILPCFDYEPSLKVEATWRLDGRLLTGSQMLSNGSIHIQRYVNHFAYFFMAHKSCSVWSQQEN